MATPPRESKEAIYSFLVPAVGHLAQGAQAETALQPVALARARLTVSLAARHTLGDVAKDDAGRAGGDQVLCAHQDRGAVGNGHVPGQDGGSGRVCDGYRGDEESLQAERDGGDEAHSF
ncbi:hypothetical protein PWT90_05662 [Aphanocladium album]|nr:hypothetical protein PWT90_05662 [Aphanocladium album]